MGDLETVKVKAGSGYSIINKSDYDEKKHTLHEDEDASDGRSEKEREIASEMDVRRKVEANRGVTGGPSIGGDGRNPSGTFSEPTPTDIRYPNKDETEFENNHGAFVGKSAAQMREAAGLPDAPGGLAPVTEEQKAKDEAKKAEADAEARKAEDEKAERAVTAAEAGAASDANAPKASKAKTAR